jgi:hypothetical protein
MSAAYQGTLFPPGRQDPILDLRGPAHLDRAAQREQTRPARPTLNEKAPGAVARRPRTGRAHRSRTSWPIACRARGARGGRSVTQESRRRRWRMYGVGRRADRRIRPQLPDRPATGRARRSLRAALFRRRAPGRDLGCPREHREEPWSARRRGRSADRRAADRPGADRPARRDAGVWGGEFGRMPFSEGPMRRDETTIPTASRCGWPAGA